MKNLVIRPLTKNDRSGIIDLLATRDGASHDSAEQRWVLLDWMAFNNPSAENEATYYIAEYKGKIVAHLGRMPADFSFRGKDFRGYFIHDLFVHPETRKMGLGFFVSIELYDRANADSGSFCCLVWTTPLNLQLQRKSGYLETYAAGLVRPLNANDFVKHPLGRKVLNPVARLLSRSTAGIVGSIRSSGVQTEMVKRCDKRFDTLWQSLKARVNICSSKSAAVLNWKYVDRPYARETIIAASRNGQFTGFVVLTTSPEKRGDKVGIVVDLLADPEDRGTLASLCQSAVRHFHSLGLGSARAVMSDPRFAAAFRRQLFLSTKNARRVVMFGNIDRSPLPADILTNTELWNLTRGESDGYMLSI